MFLDRPQLLDVCLSAPSKIQLRLVKDAFECTNIVFPKNVAFEEIYDIYNVYMYIFILLKMMDDNIFELPG